MDAARVDCVHCSAGRRCRLTRRHAASRFSRAPCTSTGYLANLSGGDEGRKSEARSELDALRDNFGGLGVSGLARQLSTSEAEDSPKAKADKRPTSPISPSKNVAMLKKLHDAKEAVGHAPPPPPLRSGSSLEAMRANAPPKIDLCK